MADRPTYRWHGTSRPIDRRVSRNRCSQRISRLVDWLLTSCGTQLETEIEPCSPSAVPAQFHVSSNSIESVRWGRSRLLSHTVTAIFISVLLLCCVSLIKLTNELFTITCMFSFFLTHQVEASPRGTGSLTLFSYFFNGICLLFNKNFALRIEAGLPLVRLWRRQRTSIVSNRYRASHSVTTAVIWRQFEQEAVLLIVVFCIWNPNISPEQRLGRIWVLQNNQRCQLPISVP